jgi:small subunit ribosomal protein S8|uniref:Small ribosomal subunit protein uS8c n=1 Tax=Cyanidioschyzon merolae TaxID=45157 RepID=A0A5P9RU71_CYAME|nr:30S ribosomal protein S8 [Cyanidioschyzon merolae]QFV17206.1 30S ribosomal protein S8 [Cyanidioschyzon merolae]
MDTLSQMLTKIRNAQMARHRWVLVPASRMNWNVAQVLREEGLIAQVQPADFHLRIQLKPKRIQRIWRVSKPGLRIYSSYKNMPKVLGMLIISTSKGVMTHQKAKQMQVGGEILCGVY